MRCKPLRYGKLQIAFRHSFCAEESRKRANNARSD